MDKVLIMNLSTNDNTLFFANNDFNCKMSLYSFIHLIVFYETSTMDQILD